MSAADLLLARKQQLEADLDKLEKTVRQRALQQGASGGSVLLAGAVGAVSWGHGQCQSRSLRRERTVCLGLHVMEVHVMGRCRSC
jgi:hypothetical protein